MSSLTPERIVNESQSTVQESYQCTICDRRFRTNRGLSQHLRSCQSKNINSTVSDTVTATDVNTLLDNQSLRNIETQEVRYKWGRYDSYQFEKNLSLVYEKIVYWKKNLFMLPSGHVGKQFIGETTQLTNEWLHDSPLKDIAFKVIIIMPSLLLQKPSKKSKFRGHLKAVEQRMDL